MLSFKRKIHQLLRFPNEVAAYLRILFTDVFRSFLKAFVSQPHGQFVDNITKKRELIFLISK